MALKVYTAAPVAANTPFTLTVPGQRLWVVKSVVAIASRAVGGTPNRAYTLTMTDGTSTLIVSPALDAGTEPGTCQITWCNGNPSNVSSGATGFSVGPLPEVTIPPGYVITGTVTNGAVTDQWTAARVWVDEFDT